MYNNDRCHNIDRPTATRSAFSRVNAKTNIGGQHGSGESSLLFTQTQQSLYSSSSESVPNYVSYSEFPTEPCSRQQTRNLQKQLPSTPVESMMRMISSDQRDVFETMTGQSSQTSQRGFLDFANKKARKTHAKLEPYVSESEQVAFLQIPPYQIDGQYSKLFLPDIDLDELDEDELDPRSIDPSCLHRISSRIAPKPRRWCMESGHEVFGRMFPHKVD